MQQRLERSHGGIGVGRGEHKINQCVRGHGHHDQPRSRQRFVEVGELRDSAIIAYARNDEDALARPWYGRWRGCWLPHIKIGWASTRGDCERDVANWLAIGDDRREWTQG